MACQSDRGRPRVICDRTARSRRDAQRQTPEAKSERHLARDLIIVLDYF